MATLVKFLIDKDGEDGVFAFFPKIKHDDQMWLSYSHVGQHASCGYMYADDCEEADYSQYQDLLRELIGQGYKDLQVINTQSFEYGRKPTAFELKQGYGATHYREFTLAETGITKTGDLKKWFKADDGLRYSR